MGTDTVGGLLSHPLVLRSAWERVKSWYRLEWAPQPEYAQWHLDPDGHLRALGEEFLAGKNQPSSFLRIPYPKRGACLRHYSMPSVRDQVAFAAHAVLLAPYVEMRLPTFAFGNRWFRGIYWDRADPRGAKWKDRPFSLADRSLYQRYSRDYGLFRRVCHWSAAAMLGTGIGEELAGRRAAKPQDYPENRLPRFVKPAWWEPEGGVKNDKGYWAHFDLQLAYPSVRLPLLRKRLHELLLEHEEEPASVRVRLNEFAMVPTPGEFDKALAGYPHEVRKNLRQQDVRCALATSLLDRLEQVSYTAVDFEFDSWIPPHAGETQILPEGDGREHPGLPTGLAICGLLLNAYLRRFDMTVAQWLLRTRKAGSPAAFVRFADDMVLLARSADSLAEGIDALWEGASGQPGARLACPPSPGEGSNLRVNWTKVEPKSLSELLQIYLTEPGQRWKGCDDCKGLTVREGTGSLAIESFAEWLQHKRSSKDKHLSKAVTKLDREALKPHRLKGFVTYLVERMSHMGSDTLLDRFGTGAQQRLLQLHELVRLDLEDEQVRTDTRLSFAVHRLARAWLPEEDPEEDRRCIEEIRESIREAVFEVPWKFGLWRAVLRASARRPTSAAGRVDKIDEEKAEHWLREMLSLLADPSHSKLSWLSEWPEEKHSEECWQHINGYLPEWERPYLSFLRASFWRALADVLVDLHRVSEVLTSSPDRPMTRAWPSRWWTFRALPDEQIGPVLKWLGALDRWAEALYGPIPTKDLKLPWWETDALTLAFLARTPRGELLNAFRRKRDGGLLPFRKIGAPEAKLIVPRGLPMRKGVRRTMQILRRLGAIGPNDDLPLFSRDGDPWAVILLARPDEGASPALGEALFGGVGVTAREGEGRV
jgi:hypothetical protein